jgi:hypothetical protein
LCKSWTTTRDEGHEYQARRCAPGRIDFAEVITGKKLPPIHPGEILRNEFLDPMKIGVYTLAQAIKVPRSRVNDIAGDNDGTAVARRGPARQRQNAPARGDRQIRVPARSGPDKALDRSIQLKSR